MTIATRLTLLLAVPLLVALGLVVYFTTQLDRIESNSHDVSITQVRSLTAVSDIARSLAEMRVNVRSYLLSDDRNKQAGAEALYREYKESMLKALATYGDGFITDGTDRRLYEDFHGLTGAWCRGAEDLMSAAAAGRRQEAAMGILKGFVPELGAKLSRTTADWIKHHDELSRRVGAESLAYIGIARRNLRVGAVLVLLAAAILGFWTSRSIVRPVQTLQASVEGIAGGEFQQPVPFTERRDETGGLARSIDVLKQGAAAMEEQRWIKSNAAELTRSLQSVSTVSQFGERILSGLVPTLGGGVGAFYVMNEGGDQLQRMATYGLPAEANVLGSIRVGNGLVGACARAGTSVSLRDLPPDYIRITSATGAATPIQTSAWPILSRDSVLAVLEFASFRQLNATESALLDELLPVVAMNLEVLSRNLATQDLLAQTQEQREQLKASEERSRLILESTANGIFGTDTQGSIDFINPAACQMLGFTQDELLGRPSHATFHHHRADGSEYPKEECPMFAAYTHGRSSYIDNEFLWRKDGNGFPVEYGARPVFKDGVLVGSVVSFADITERRQAEQRLRETEQFFRSVLESAPDALMVVDHHGVIQLANAQSEKLFGHTRDELVGQRVEILIPENVRPGHAALRAAFHAAPVARAMGASRELSGLRKDGSEFPVEIGLSPLPARNSEPAQVAVSIRDVTERKQQERQIVEARQRAEEATAAKSMFLANMSHEIRTPMNAIIGMTHLALKTELTPKQRDYLTKVRGAAGALLGIINDILDFSKIEAGKLDIENAEFRFEDVLENLSTVVSQKAHEKNLEFLISAQPEIPPRLVGDPLRLGQILINLVNNAVKFTERGEVIVTVGVEERSPERVQLAFSVRDSGIGMTPEQVDRLFQAFSQADTSTTRKFGGTGLGLSISKRLVEMMGGEISAESEAGKGSTFRFTAEFGIGAVEHERARFVPDLAGIRALVVDDNAQAREILGDALRGFSLRVDAVPSGRDAVQTLAAADSQDPYNLVLMDWQMPGMDGLQASAVIRRDLGLKHRPRIIMVTAYGREELRTQAEQVGIDAYVTKPVNASVLYDTLMEQFGTAQLDSGGITHHKAPSAEYNARGIRVLLVEDNEMNQQVATELLESAGAIVTVAGHGGIAVKLLMEGPQPPPFDIVLMDLQMPEVDGLAATRLLRAEPRFDHLPILAMTAHALVEERERCLQAGMNDHVTKPIDPDALFAALARWTKPRESAAMAAAGAETPQVQAPLPEIEGIDIAGALKRVAGNQRLYRNLLDQFAEKQGAAARDIHDALAKGERALGERLAHTVKGVAANLGMTQVQASAAEVERGIRSNEASLPAMLASLASALEFQVAAIRRVLVTGVPQRAQSAFDPEQAATAIARLRTLLADNDGDAADAFDAVESALSGTGNAQHLRDLKDAIAAFDFDAAAATLDEIARECHIARREQGA